MGLSDIAVSSDAFSASTNCASEQSPLIPEQLHHTGNDVQRDSAMFWLIICEP